VAIVKEQAELFTVTGRRRHKFTGQGGKRMKENKLGAFLITLKNLEEEIRKEYKAEVIGLFGSYVRGEQKKDSDLDILVRFHEGATLFSLIGLADFLSSQL